jgi:hypothetical protein
MEAGQLLALADVELFEARPIGMQTMNRRTRMDRDPGIHAA